MIEQTKKIVFGIVTYKEFFWETITFQTLVNSLREYNCLNKIIIYIVDNTDSEGWVVTIPKEYKDLVIYKNLPNPGISVAYNKIQEYAFEREIEWIVLLDQDTTLPLNCIGVYMQAIDNKKTMIKAPIIHTERGLLSPLKYKYYRSHSFFHIKEGVISIDNISCINTGLMINTYFFQKVGGYNKKLKLDFCDHDFIERAKQLTKKLQILGMHLFQDFSSITHTREQAIERYKRFILDFYVFGENRNKFLLLFCVDLPRLIKQTFKYKTLEFIKIRIKYLLKK